MYCLEVSKNRSFVWDPKIDRFLYVVQNKRENAYTLAHVQRLRRIIEIVRLRKGTSGKTSTLCTAFMMKLAKDFGSHRVATKTLEDLKGVSNDNKESVMTILSDVFYDRIKVIKHTDLVALTWYSPFSLGNLNKRERFQRMIRKRYPHLNRDRRPWHFVHQHPHWRNCWLKQQRRH
jgi:hypothetical protein